MAAKGVVLQIQRFSVDDGPGIRTTVFLKGCPLRCVWCHNPESFLAAPQLSYRQQHCIGCLRCEEACPHGLHTFKEEHQIDFGACTHCGSCVAACPTCALQMLGSSYTAEGVLREVEKDRPYFSESGGGLTVSGGEATSTPQFLLELLEGASARGLHTCLDTSGQTSWALLELLLPLVNLFLYDYKLWDSEQHRRYTGVDNSLILENLCRLHDAGAAIILRCPIIPGINDTQEQFAAIRQMCRRLPRLQGVEIMPYHNIGAGKWRELGLEYTLAELPSATSEQLKMWQRCIE